MTQPDLGWLFSAIAAAEAWLQRAGAEWTTALSLACLLVAVVPLSASVMHYRRAHRRRSDDLRLANQRLCMATAVAGVGVWEWLPVSRKLTWNPVMFSLYGIAPRSSLDAAEWEALVVPESREKLRRLLDRIGGGGPHTAVSCDGQGAIDIGVLQPVSGDIRWLKTTWQWQKRGGEPCLIGTQVDVTEEQSTLRKLFRDVYLDTLTGLLNKRALHDHMNQFTVARENRASSQAMLFLDLDGFKQVNDTLGHAIGDELLKAVARRLRVNLRQEDRIYRLGGDEFVVWLRGGFNEQDALARVAAKLVASVARPYDLNDNTCEVSVSLGMAVYPRDAETPERLLQAADTAMYAAKAAGKNCYRMYEPCMAQAAEAPPAARQATPLKTVINH